MVRSVSIYGVGSSGCASCVHLELREKKSALYGHPDHRGTADILEEQGYLDAVGSIKGRGYPVIMKDLGKLLAFSAFLVIVVPATGHADVLAELERYDLSRHIITVFSGKLFALRAVQRIRARAWVETSSSPTGARMLDERQNEQLDRDGAQGYAVRILGLKKSLSIASLPVDMGEDLRAEVADIFSSELTLEWHDNILVCALQTVGAVLHPTTAFLNVGWIEHTLGDFGYYPAAMTASVIRKIEKVDAFRMAILRALGYVPRSVLDTLNKLYGLNARTLREFIELSPVHRTMKVAPSSMKHRYIEEDLQYFWVFMEEIGKGLGLYSKEVDYMFESGYDYNHIDYRKNGRDLRSLGLEGCTPQEMVAKVSVTAASMEEVFPVPAGIEEKIKVEIAAY